MPDNTVTQPGWEITEHVRDDGGTTMVAYVGDDPTWAAYELIEAVAGYRWHLYPVTRTMMDHPGALVRDKAAARAWLEHEAQNALLAAKVVAA